MNIVNLYKRAGFVISGRNALSEYKLTSRDDNVIFLESSIVNPGALLNMIFVPEDKTDVTMKKNNAIYASFSKALLDLIDFEYDDSTIYEVFDTMNE